MLRWPGHVPPGRVFNGIQGYKMNGTTYKVHLDGYNNLDRWTGKTEKSARHEILDYDETDLMAVDGWTMHIGVKTRDNWFDPKSYPSVPYVVNLLMDPMEKMTPNSEEYGYISGPFLAEHLKSCRTSSSSELRNPQREEGHRRSDQDEAIKKMQAAAGSSN
jgi:hypothetical protein